jgi:hypothetical protein
MTSAQRKWKTIVECYTLRVHGLLTGTEDFSVASKLNY